MSTRARLRKVRSALGSRLDLGPVLYRRGVFEYFDEVARNDAHLVIDALVHTFPEARSFADAGAGTGQFVAQLRQRGIGAMGMERSGIARRMAREAYGVRLQRFNLCFRPRPVKVDVAYSFEVAEHVPGRLAARFARFLADCAPIVVMTAAHPGQGGIGHINEQPPAYWEKIFRDLGRSRDEPREKQFMDGLPLERLSPHWSKTNVFVFV